MTINYYTLLHVQRDAPVAIIKASYRAMMQKMQHHPDLGGDESIAQQLNLAVSILCDPAKRVLYDQSLDDTDTGDDISHKPHGDQEHNARARTEGEPQTEKPVYKRLPEKDRCPFCRSTQADAQAGGIHGYDPIHECLQCGSALTPVGSINNIGDEAARRIHRQAHAMPAALWHSWPQKEPLDATMVDFSTAGCALDSLDEFHAGHRLLIKTDLFVAVCQVCFCKPSTTSGLSLLGLEFITLNLKSSPGSFITMAV